MLEGQAQLPLLQDPPVLQTLPQPLQLLTSLLMSTHVPKQRSPLHVQAPCLHV